MIALIITAAECTVALCCALPTPNPAQITTSHTQPIKNYVYLSASLGPPLCFQDWCPKGRQTVTFLWSCSGVKSAVPIGLSCNSLPALCWSQCQCLIKAWSKSSSEEATKKLKMNISPQKTGRKYRFMQKYFSYVEYFNNNVFHCDFMLGTKS